MPVSLRVRPSAQLVEVITRAMTRVAARRFDPVLCVDEVGRLLGLVRAERMTLRLAELYSGAGADLSTAHSTPGSATAEPLLTSGAAR